MRQLVAALVAAGLAACNGSQQQAGLQTVRLAIHQDPIAFLPVRLAQTLGYYEEAGLAVETSEVAGGTKALQALLGGSADVAAASMSDAVQLAVEGRDVRGFLVLYTRPTAALAVAPSLSRTIRTIRDLKRPHRWCLRSGVRESSNPQLSPGFQRSLARRGQHRVGRHVGQLCGRTRARKRRRGGLAWECDFSIREPPAAPDLPRRSPHTGRRTAGVWLRGLPVTGPVG